MAPPDLNLARRRRRRCAKKFSTSRPLREKNFSAALLRAPKIAEIGFGKGSPKKKVRLPLVGGSPKKIGGPPKKSALFSGGPPDFPGDPQVPGRPGGPRGRPPPDPAPKVGDSSPPAEKSRRRQFQGKNVECIFRWGNYDFSKGSGLVYYTSLIKIAFLERFSRKFPKFLTRRQKSWVTGKSNFFFSKKF